MPACVPVPLFHFRNHLTFSAHVIWWGWSSPSLRDVHRTKYFRALWLVKGKQMTSTGHWESGLGLWSGTFEKQNLFLIATAWSCWWPFWPLLGNSLWEEPWRRKDTERRRNKEALETKRDWFQWHGFYINSDKPVVMLSLASFSKLFITIANNFLFLPLKSLTWVMAFAFDKFLMIKGTWRHQRTENRASWLPAAVWCGGLLSLSIIEERTNDQRGDSTYPRSHRC